MKTANQINLPQIGEYFLAPISEEQKQLIMDEWRRNPPTIQVLGLPDMIEEIKIVCRKWEDLCTQDLGTFGEAACQIKRILQKYNA